GRDVPLPATDRSFVSGNRKVVQRQAPFDRHALRREDRKVGRGRPGFPQGDRGLSAALPLDGSPPRGVLPLRVFPHAFERVSRRSRSPRFRPPGTSARTGATSVSSPFFGPFSRSRGSSTALLRQLHVI